ncbi:MAG: ATP-dependent DNA ligase [Sphingobacteriales bacterium]|nr:MAG: ATP-dependent DNA ligase [Sphingobacteriales bacterium]
MKRFALLIEALQGSTKTNDKKEALVKYLQEAPEEDRIWLVALFSGRRPKRIVTSTLLKLWCMEEARIQPWLFDESYHTVGDLSEAIALMLPAVADTTEQDLSLAQMMARIQALQTASEDEKKAFILHEWRTLSQSACYLFNKLISGGFRIGVSEALLIQGVALYAGKDAQTVAHLLSGGWTPDATSLEALLSESEDQAVDFSKPYPFYLSYPVENGVESLGAPIDWQVEWKWDGIRGQLIRRNGEVFLWSRGEELITDRFPELKALAGILSDGTVLDGEILAYREGRPLSFQYLQTRTTRKTVSKKELEAAPAIFMAYDLLEEAGEDLRSLPMDVRRRRLEALCSKRTDDALILSPVVPFERWDELPQLLSGARERGVEGFMIKRRASSYQAGRKRGDWWKWKIDPLTIDAVMVYAQKGHGRRSNLFTDYTFAVRDGDRFVPFAKAYSGLTDKEIASVDRWVKANSIEQFGPVKTVKPELVFEIGFEGISASSRHKSGVAVRFPRILKWRTDKAPDEVNTLDELKEMLQLYGNP